MWSVQVHRYRYVQIDMYSYEVHTYRYVPIKRYSHVHVVPVPLGRSTKYGYDDKITDTVANFL